jgi:hypothetical protein
MAKTKPAGLLTHEDRIGDAVVAGPDNFRHHNLKIQILGRALVDNCTRKQ